MRSEPPFLAVPRFRKRLFAQPVPNSSPAMNSFYVEPGLLIKLSTAILSFETNFVKSKSCLKIRSICGTISVVTSYILQPFRSKISRLRNISCKLLQYFLVEAVCVKDIRSYCKWYNILNTVPENSCAILPQIEKMIKFLLDPGPIIFLPDSLNHYLLILGGLIICEYKL